MEYTVQKLGQLGISTRTLRYYDQIELLKTSANHTSGYPRVTGGKVWYTRGKVKLGWR